MNGVSYDAAQRITLGMKAADCRFIMDEWLHREAPCTLTVRRAKTKGLLCVVADINPNENPDGLYFLSWCVQHLNSRVKVDIKRL